MGLCGYSAAPLSDATASSVLVEEPLGFPGTAITWRGIGGYRETLATAGPGTNVATLVGHNTVRRLVVGAAGRPATTDEIGGWPDLVETAMDEGAVGFSSGLTYAPGMYGDRAELTELAAAAARHGGVYHTHMRYGDLGILGSVDDAIATAAAAGARVNISHLYPSPDDSPNLPDRVAERLAAARERGVDVTFDLTLFRRGCGPWTQGLPTWALDGGTTALRARLREPDGAQRRSDRSSRPPKPPQHRRTGTTPTWSTSRNPRRNGTSAEASPTSRASPVWSRSTRPSTCSSRTRSSGWVRRTSARPTLTPCSATRCACRSPTACVRIRTGTARWA